MGKELSFSIPVHKFPTLYKLNSNGKLQVWDIQAQEDDGSGIPSIVTIFGQKDGKLQTSVVQVPTGKNLGKANETGAYEQACLEAESQWKKQQERRGYVTDKSLVDQDLRQGAEPMLAHRYDKNPEKITFPCYIQPKFDGHRCIAIYTHDLLGDGDECKVELFSRQRKLITGLPHINEAVRALISKAFKGAVGRFILDGELYNHEYKDNFEALTGFIRSQEPKEGCEAVQFHVYDVVDETGKRQQDERYGALNAIMHYNSSDTIQQVSTILVYNDIELNQHFRVFRDRGYEGAILRNADGLYVGARSYDLQKVKEFDDAEFIITGVEEGKGKMQGHAIFVCQTDRGKEFRARMKGSLESLALIYQYQSDYIGRQLTVMYQGLTTDGIPRFPVGLRVREDV